MKYNRTIEQRLRETRPPILGLVIRGGEVKTIEKGEKK